MLLQKRVWRMRVNKPSVWVALINCMEILRPKKEVAVSITPPTKLTPWPKMPVAVSITPPLPMEVMALKSNTFFGINTTVPFIFCPFLPNIPPVIFATFLLSYLLTPICIIPIYRYHLTPPMHHVLYASYFFILTHPFNLFIMDKPIIL